MTDSCHYCGNPVGGSYTQSLEGQLICTDCEPFPMTEHEDPQTGYIDYEEDEPWLLVQQRADAALAAEAKLSRKTLNDLLKESLMPKIANTPNADLLLKNEEEFPEEEPAPETPEPKTKTTPRKPTATVTMDAETYQALSETAEKFRWTPPQLLSVVAEAFAAHDPDSRTAYILSVLNPSGAANPTGA